MRPAIAAALLAVAAGTIGCRTGPLTVSGRPPKPVDRVDKVALRISPPMPLNWDDRPGLDGFQAQVNFFQLDRPLSVTVEGVLEFMLYEGRGTVDVLAETKPVQTWAFEGPTLRRHQGKTMFGWGYAMRLPWGPSPPKSSSVTLIARYRPAGGGKDIPSDPLHVAMGPK